MNSVGCREFGSAAVAFLNVQRCDVEVHLRLNRRSECFSHSCERVLKLPDLKFTLVTVHHEKWVVRVRSAVDVVRSIQPFKVLRIKLDVVGWQARAIRKISCVGLGECCC